MDAQPPAPSAATVPPVPSATPAAPPGPAAPTAASGPNAEKETAITLQLKKIYDPEIPMNIVDLGLIYGFDWKGEDVTLHMTLTSPGCPVAGVLADEIKGVMEKIPGVHSATVDFIWEPAWNPERMSEFAKRQFGYL
jgi:metal-sulfur cluster biosynthetic enzyme